MNFVSASELPPPPEGSDVIVAPSQPQQNINILPPPPVESIPMDQAGGISVSEIGLPPPPIGSEPITQPQPERVLFDVVFFSATALLLVLLVILARILTVRRRLL